MRLPLLRPADLTSEQQSLYRTFDAMVATDEFAGMVTKQPDGAFLGPFAVMLHFPAAGEALARFCAEVSALPGLSPTARQVVILTVGGRQNAAYELYAHTIAAHGAGLRPDQIATLCAGGRPADLTAEENLAADVTGALLRGGPLPRSSYQAVVDKFGQEALDAMVLLTVQYLAICTLLNAYDVPTPTETEQS
ncbi:MAG TPA: carboxymuconolactone decarboxylase family protein [Pseudonocardiaceae bacterium]|jgi:4-carboxymuconolactone decarboxylase|nr:carboxymuconolactone decarboxylase family protein [Pseudonocardiaceae bacterium]